MDMIDRLFNCDYKSVNAKDENGKTVVHLVCENSELDSQILKKIIDGGVNVDTFDLAGNKPIHVIFMKYDVLFLTLRGRPYNT
jgi:hypothetical protein